MKKRGTFAALALFTLFTALPVPAESRLFVFFEGRSPAVFDGRTLARVATLKAGADAVQALGTPGGEYYLVGPEGIRILDSEFQPAGQVETPEPLAAGPSPAVYAPESGTLWVAAGSSVYEIHAASRAVAVKLELDFEAAGMLAPPGASQAYVFSRETRQVALLDLERAAISPQNLWLPEPPAQWTLSAEGEPLAASGEAVYRLDRLIPSLVAPPERLEPRPSAPGPGAVVLGGRLIDEPHAAATAAAADPDGGLFLANGDRLEKLAPNGERIETVLPAPARALSLVATPVEQSAGGSLIQQFGSGQTVAVGAPFEIGVRALSASRVPIVGLQVAVSSVAPAGNSVICQPGITDRGGAAVIHCGASGVAEPTDLSITVTDAEGRAAPPFSIRVEPVEIEDGLRSLTGDILTTPRNTLFQIVVQAAADGVTQPGLELTVRVDPGFPLISCPSLFMTDINGMANIICRTNRTNAPVTSNLTVTDPFGRRVEVTVVVVPHVTLGDGPHKAAGDGQTVTRFGVLPRPLSVTALEGGLPRDDVRLDVSTSAGQLFCPAFVVTNEQGQVNIICSASDTSARTFVRVFVTDPEERGLDSPFTVTVLPINPGSAEDLILKSEPQLAGQVGAPLPEAIQTLAVDGGGAAVPGVSVFVSAVGDVLFNPSVATTDQGGDATIDVTPGCPARDELIRVGLSSGTPIHTIPLQVLPGPPRIISKVQGDLQTGAEGELLNQEALVIEITDICGARLRGREVDWSVEPADAAQLENVIALTDGAGRSSALVRLGQRPGPFRVIARSGDLAAVFNLAVEQIPGRVEAVSGDGQRVMRGEPAPEPLTVRVLDQGGLPLPGALVRYEVTAGQATLLNSAARTGPEGLASATVQAGDRLGRVTVTASVEAAPVIAAAGRGPAQSALFHVFRLDVVGATPTAQAGAFVNGASFAAGWTPGAIGTIFGSTLLEDVDGVVIAGPAPFPTTLRGVAVSVNGVAAPIVGLADVEGRPQQINVQVPFEAEPGSVDVQLFNNGASATVSGVTVNAVQPGIFQFSDSGGLLAAALHADFRPVTRADPATPGETILLFATGLGPLTPAVASNEAGPSPPARTVLEPVVGLDDAGMTVLGSFYAPGLIGTYQVNFVVSAEAAAGDRKLSLIADGAASQDAVLPVGDAF